MRKTTLIIGLLTTMSYAQVSTFPEGETGKNAILKNGRMEIIVNANNGNLIRFSTDRPWTFKNKNTGASARLQLESLVPGKFFDILEASSGYKVASFFTHNEAYHQRVFLVENGGRVGIGTNNPDAELAVNGIIHSKEVKVDLVGWPDYVFEKEYTLPTLLEVEKHIKEKGHLQNIPSAKQVEEHGVELGKMNKLLLEKVEELTLYTIEQEKKLQQQQTKNQKLESKNLELEARLSKIENLINTDK